MTAYWISVKDEMPPNMQQVIVEGGIAYYREKEEQWYSITAFNWPGKPITWDVTHWMPFPKLNK